MGLLRVHECRCWGLGASEWLLDLDEAKDAVSIDELATHRRRILKQALA